MAANLDVDSGDCRSFLRLPGTAETCLAIPLFPILSGRRLTDLLPHHAGYVLGDAFRVPVGAFAREVIFLVEHSDGKLL